MEIINSTRNHDVYYPICDKLRKIQSLLHPLQEYPCVLLGVINV